jgi:hypothetical protein
VDMTSASRPAQTLERGFLDGQLMPLYVDCPPSVVAHVAL